MKHNLISTQLNTTPISQTLLVLYLSEKYQQEYHTLQTITSIFDAIVVLEFIPNKIYVPLIRKNKKIGKKTHVNSRKHQVL